VAVGCTGDLIYNLTEERSGTITVLIINDTPYRAAFSFGSYDGLNRDPPGAIDFVQSRIEAHTTPEPFELECRRNVAIATEDLRQRAIDTREYEEEEFDADAFSAVVHFSAAPPDDAQAASPTAGYAEGVEVLLGIDYACGDQLVFTFVEDAAASGGFQVEFSLLRTEGDS
jgi:hypothetical protein